MPEAARCKSCSMTIENGTYCRYCTDDEGSLFSFAETFERFVQFAMQRDETLSRPEAERHTAAFMRTMPAWRDHPEL